MHFHSHSRRQYPRTPSQQENLDSGFQAWSVPIDCRLFSCHLSAVMQPRRVPVLLCSPNAIYERQPSQLNREHAVLPCECYGTSTGRSVG